MQPDAYRNDTSITLNAPWEALRHQEQQIISESRFRSPRPRIIDPDWIDLHLIKGWLKECLGHHQNTCNLIHSDLSPVQFNLILVDTVQACLMRSVSSCRYVALSYVWGYAGNFLTTSANLQQLCQPGALQQMQEAQSNALPRTIHQAIQLTRAIGERYLWVDSLCIIQDGVDKVDQLNAMASIFANATLTVVVAEGIDADAGFKGLHNISQPRNAHQYVAPLLPDLQLVRPSSKHVWDESLLQPWSMRAWTFQESIFSRRVLYFAHESVRWSCKKARWSEESESSDCLRAYASLEQRQFALSSPRLSTSTLPMLDEYQALVNAFNVRKLTYPEDVLSAFAGVSSRLSTKFSGGLISGLPEIFFDVCLLWRPMRRLGPAIRRQSTSIIAQHSLPSWSWSGWDTEVSWPYTWNHHEDPARPVAISFGDLYPFYQVDFHAIYETETTLINNSWLKSARPTFDGQLPPGWSSHQVSDSELREYGKDEPVCFFRHETERSAEFWFPVPHSPALQAPRTPGILQFDTTSAQFRLGETRRSMTRIYALDGTHAGTLWQHDEDDEDFLQATCGAIGIRAPIEFVAILGCTIPTEELVIWDQIALSTPKAYDKQARSPRTEDVYNVMWVRRQGAISYRKATGEILRHIWDRSKLSHVSLRLG